MLRIFHKICSINEKRNIFWKLLQLFLFLLVLYKRRTTLSNIMGQSCICIPKSKLPPYYNISNGIPLYHSVLIKLSCLVALTISSFVGVVSRSCTEYIMVSSRGYDVLNNLLKYSRHLLNNSFVVCNEVKLFTSQLHYKIMTGT